MKKRLCAAALSMLLFCTAFGAGAEKTITIHFVGDCTLGYIDFLAAYDNCFPYVIEQNGLAYPFQNVADMFAGDDLTIANLEGVLTDEPTGAKDKKYLFHGATEYANILPLGGVDMVCLANNHTMDYGKKGYASTIQALETAGVDYYDNTTSRVVELQGVRVAVFGLSSDSFDREKKRIKDEIAAYKNDGVSAVIVSIHMGTEYGIIRTTRQTRSAKYMVDAGADLVVFHHAHVIMGFDVYKNRSICYGLGNFVFGGNVALVRRGTKTGRTSLETMVLQAVLTFSDDHEYLGQQLRIYPAFASTSTEENDYQPRLVSGDEAAQCIALMQDDTPFPLAPYDPAAGCAPQPYLPAQPHED